MLQTLQQYMSEKQKEKKPANPQVKQKHAVDMIKEDDAPITEIKL